MIELQPDLELTLDQARHLIELWSGPGVSCSAVEPLKGGLVNSVFRIDIDRPPYRVVVKVRRPAPGAFSHEASALTLLDAETSCPVPRVLLHDDQPQGVDLAYLLLEHVDGACLAHLEVSDRDRQDLDRQLAVILAELHDHTGDTWGRPGGGDGDASWGAIVAGRLADVRRSPAVIDRLPGSVLDEVDAAIAAAPAVLTGGVRPTLVHADVWEGNTMVRRDGEGWRIAALLDPDLQYADPEMELAYLEVFDHDRSELFREYTRHHSLRPGYEHRRRWYWLLTALVHVALFGDEFFCDYTARVAADVAAD